ncbi:solute carrier family 25 member 35-like [Pectinophora gossypiella]|uniref:solute carrier family 25 member 35-like n=1 Tax=Pectinophora gossypiella TaxID=13191 RepID=UPI00214F3285|nr:solute carrier family 25 member 35-like [Pectinophora gossypiella]
MDFVIGGLAGAGATVITNPMDVVKTRLQLQGEMRARKDTSAQYRGTLHALYVIARTDGAFALQRGLTPAVLLGFTMNGIRLGLYHMADERGWIRNRKGVISVYKAAFWAGVSGYVGAMVSNPLCVIKTRIQATSHPSIAVGRQHRYNGMMDAISTIYKTEGVRGFFAGVNAICIRLAIGSAAQLTTFSATKEKLINHNICDKNSPFALAFLASCISGIAVALTVCPLDVATVRLYNQGAATSSGLLYNGLFDCLRKIYKTEGLHGLFKGIGPLYFRMAPHTTLSLVIWDVLNHYFVK